jgi:hypothetical protein
MLGCQNRGADDRVIDQYQRQEMHGPGYTVVTMRRTDPARLAEGGNVVIITNGFEPVFATDSAFYEVPVEPVTARRNESKELLQELNALDRKLAAAEAAKPKQAPLPQQGESLSPVPTAPSSPSSSAAAPSGGKDFSSHAALPTLTDGKHERADAPPAAVSPKDRDLQIPARAAPEAAPSAGVPVPTVPEGRKGNPAPQGASPARSPSTNPSSGSGHGHAEAPADVGGTAGAAEREAAQSRGTSDAEASQHSSELPNAVATPSTPAPSQP